MSSAPGVDPGALFFVEQSLMRGCASHFERARVARDFDDVTHAEVYSAVTATFDAHQAALLALMAKVGRVSNSLAPVNKLPLDALVEILVNLPVEDRMQASRVCSHWRAAAVATAHVWAELELSISSRSTARLFELLDRSKSADVYLDLTLHGNREMVLETTSRLYPYFTRLRSFSWLAAFSAPDFEDFFLQEHDRLNFAIPPAPVLRTALLNSTAITWMQAPCVFRFSETANAYTTLERLHLRRAADATFDFWPEMPSLRHLHFHWSPTLSTSTLYRVLRSTPALEELIVENLYDKMALPVGSDIENSPTLSHLNLLSLYGLLEEDTLRRLFADLVPDSVRSIMLKSKYALSEVFSWTTSWNFSRPQKLFGILSPITEEMDPYTGDRAYPKYNVFHLRVDDSDDRSRVFWDISEPTPFISGITTSLRELCVDCYVWARVPEGAKFPVLKTLSVLGHLENVEALRPDVHASVPALRIVRFFIGTRWRTSESWNPKDIISFLSRQIRGYRLPLRELFVLGGRVNKDNRHTPKLAGYAKRVVMGREGIDELEFDEMLDWFPARDWDVEEDRDDEGDDGGGNPSSSL